jgi:hypothetical protein
MIFLVDGVWGEGQREINYVLQLKLGELEFFSKFLNF